MEQALSILPQSLLQCMSFSHLISCQPSFHVSLAQCFWEIFSPLNIYIYISCFDAFYQTLTLIICVAESDFLKVLIFKYMGWLHIIYLSLLSYTSPFHLLYSYFILYNFIFQEIKCTWWGFFFYEPLPSPIGFEVDLFKGISNNVENYSSLCQTNSAFYQSSHKKWLALNKSDSYSSLILQAELYNVNFCWYHWLWFFCRFCEKSKYM